MKKLFILFFMIVTVMAARESGAKYLIITHDDFYNDIKPLAEWKHKKGMPTKVVKYSEIGSGSTAIRNYIVTAYNTWDIPPEYVLLVGSPDRLPWGMTSPYSDNPYMNLEGDIRNEILAGRLTVHNSTEAQTVVNKILLYERTPYMGDSTWMRNACLIVNEDGYTYPPVQGTDDYIYWGDSRHAYGLMLGNGYIRMDTLSELLGNNYNNVLQSVNSGVGFLQYRGQGVGNWWSPFGVNPDAAANGSMLPIVLSITCSTIGTGSTPATAEKWLLTGSPTSPRGGSAYFATTTVRSHVANLRSAVSRGFFTGIFDQRKRTFGEACEAGRSNLLTTYGDTYDYYGFATLGDPEMNIWTKTPMASEVVHVQSLNTADESLAVFVSVGGSLFDSALVCAYLDTSYYEYAYTQGGLVVFQLNGLHPGHMDITVTGRNLIPYESTITIVDDNPYLLCTTHTLNDSLGNGNGIPESGETVLMRVTAANIGVNPAYGVRATLRSDDAYVSIIDSVSYFGTVLPQDSATGMSPYSFTISNLCPDGHAVNFTVLMHDSAGLDWQSDFAVDITNNATGPWVGPDDFGYYMYDDTDTLTGYAPTFDWYTGAMSLVAEITDEDADTVTYSLPFAFPFYGIIYNSAGLCSNGFLEMGTSTYRFGANTAIPSATGPRRFVAPFWDDLDPSAAGTGDIYYANDTTENRWILEYRSVAHYGNTSQRETFQVQLRDPLSYPTPDGNGEILFLYDTVMNATSNTVGIENHTQTVGLQYVFDNAYHPSAAPLANGRAILVTTKPPAGIWLHTVQYSFSDSVTGNNNGIIDPGETIQIFAHVMNSGNATANNVATVLRTGDADAVITDSTADLGSILPGATSGNELEPFTVQIGASPADTTIGFSLHMECNAGAYQKADYFTFYLYFSVGAEELNAALAAQLNLSVYPNPFRSSASIGFTIQDTRSTIENVKLRVYDVSGRVVKTLDPQSCIVNHESRIVWDGTDEHGRRLSSGIYFISLDHAGKTEQAKVILVR